MIKIYNIDGSVIMCVEIAQDAKREEELAKSDYISLSFNAAVKIVLPVGAYIEHSYYIDTVRMVKHRFSLLEEYEPTQTSESSWKYTPSFQHPKMLLSKIPFYIKTKNSRNEDIKQYVWSFTGTPQAMVDKLCNFLNNDIKFGSCGWKSYISSSVTNTLNVSFSDNDFISALTSIASAIGDNCEWHIDYDNEILYVGHISIDDGEQVLEIGKNVGISSVTNSKENFYNVFAIFGGSRNITQTNSYGENISSGDIRLQLDKGNGSLTIDGRAYDYTIDEFSTLDLRKDKTQEPLFMKVLDFSDIFPSLNTYVYDVRGREKYVINENGNKVPLTYNTDGSVAEYKTFTVWYMRLAYPSAEKINGKTVINITTDNGVTHYWYDFEITDDLLVNGKNLSCYFEANFNTGALSTPLAGRGANGSYVGFELTYHKENMSSHTSDDVNTSDFKIKTGDYEIIYQEDNNVFVPSNESEKLIPRGESLPSYKCNITVLYNIAMNEGIYYADAKKRLLDKAIEEITRLRSDLNNYEVKSYPHVFKSNNPRLQIGQKVTFKDGCGYSLSTRILKLSTNIDFDFVQDIKVGNQAIKGSITKLQEDVQAIVAGGLGSNSGAQYTPSQIRSLVEKYGTSYFLSKKFKDTAHEEITFAKGLFTGTYKKGVSGGNMDGEGNAETNKLTARGDTQLRGDTFFGTGPVDDKTDTPHVDGGSGDALLGDVVLKALQSKDFDALLQRGFGFTKGVNGKFTLSVTDLLVWGKAIFNELEIRRLSSIGGNVYLSGASSKIAHVKEEMQDGQLVGWRCYILADDGTTATQNGWKMYDQARCQTFDIASGSHEGVGNRNYWRLVTGVSSTNETITDADGNDLYNGKKFAWVVLSATDCEDRQTNDVPAAGDVIVLDGHRQFAEDDPRAMNNDASRTNIMMLQTTGSEGSVPNIISLQGIVDYKHSASNNKYSNTVFILSPEEVVFLSSRFKWISASGAPITLVNFRGAWKQGETYYYYDQVSHNNAIWTCIVAEDSSTTEEPTDESEVWRKDLTGGVPGDKGDPGKDGTDGVDGANGYTVTATPSVITLGIKKVSDTEFVADVSKNNTSSIRVFKGDVDVTTTCRLMVANTKNCTATGPSVGGSGLIKVTRMSTYTTADGDTYPLTSGSVTVDVRVGSATLSHTIAVSVEMSTVWGGIETSVRGLKSEFGELQQDLQSEAPNVLTKYTSKIEQTAKSISAKVAQETVGRLNVLPGTAFNRETDVTQQRPDTFPCTILPLGGLEGTGAMVINQKGATDTTWSGLVWKGVVLKPKTYYTASVWARADGDLDDVMYLSIGQDTNFCYLNLATANETHDWKMFKATFKTGDTEASCNNVRVELAVRKNGRGRCCKLMLDESGTYNGWTPASYADVSSRALEATGIDIKNKTIDMTADKFTLRNNHGEKSFGVDEDGNLEARSLKSVSKDGSLTAIIKDGAFTALSGLSGATAFFGLIDGMPYLQFTNAAGVVCYAIGPSGGQVSGNVGVQMTACGVKYSVSTIDLVSKKNYWISYSGSVTLQNFGSESAKIYQSKLQLVIDGFTQTLTASFKDSSFPMTEVGQGKVMTLMPGKLMQAEFEINAIGETMPTTGSDGSVIAKPSGARGCQLKLNGEVIGKGAIN